MRCGVLLDGHGIKSSTIKAVQMAMAASKRDKKGTAALEQALSLLTSGLPQPQLAAAAASDSPAGVAEPAAQEDAPDADVPEDRPADEE